MKPIILHIPHSSIHIPFKDGYLVDDSILKLEMQRLTDWYTEDLYQGENTISVKANFSRIFCDVERFSNDQEEIMSTVGMGMIYEKTTEGLPLRKVTPTIRKTIYEKYYCVHHQRLVEAVESQLLINNKALILDCHSFPNIPHPMILDAEIARPNFSIGTCNFHTPEELIDLSIAFFEYNGFSISVNTPYSGTMVPTNYYLVDKRVQSIMLEINRKLYMEGIRKSENYSHIKSLVNRYVKLLQNCI